jgi:hypothetical protein
VWLICKRIQGPIRKWLLFRRAVVLYYFVHLRMIWFKNYFVASHLEGPWIPHHTMEDGAEHKISSCLHGHWCTENCTAGLLLFAVVCGLWWVTGPAIQVKLLLPKFVLFQELVWVYLSLLFCEKSIDLFIFINSTSTREPQRPKVIKITKRFKPPNDDSSTWTSQNRAAVLALPSLESGKTCRSRGC